MGRVVLCLFIHYVLIANAFAGDIAYKDLFTFKQGEIQKNEVWSGKILLLGDVVVPAGVDIEIKDNAWLVFNEVDLQNVGVKPEEPELIIHGDLYRPSGENNVQMFALGDPQVQSYINSQMDKETIVVQPTDEPMQDLKQDLNKSRRYYSLIWAFMYTFWLII